MKGKLLMATFVLALALAAVGVLATISAPTCTYGGDTPITNATTERENDTVTLYFTTSINITNATVALYPGMSNVTITIPEGTTDNMTWAYNFTNVPDGTYKMQAKVEALNTSAENAYENFTNLHYGYCEQRIVIVATENGVLIEDLLEEKKVPDHTLLIILAGAVIVLLLATNNKK